MSFSNEQIEELRVRLLEEKKRILSNLKTAKKNSRFGEGIDDADDETEETEEFANYLGIEHIEKDAIHEIDIALEKIKEGSYGACEQCERQISHELLSIQPESALCKECKLSEK